MTNYNFDKSSSTLLLFLPLSELWSGDRQSEGSGGEDESSHQQPAHVHVRPQEEPDIRRQHLQETPQWLPHLCGGAHRSCQESSGLAGQVRPCTAFWEGCPHEQKTFSVLYLYVQSRVTMVTLHSCPSYIKSSIYIQAPGLPLGLAVMLVFPTHRSH